MSGFAKELLSGPGCTVEGVTSTRNPMGQLVDAVFAGPRVNNGHVRGHPGLPVGADMHSAIRNGFHGHRSAPRGPQPGTHHGSSPHVANWGADYARHPNQRNRPANWGGSFQGQPHPRQNWALEMHRSSPGGVHTARPTYRSPMHNGRGVGVGVNPLMATGGGMVPMVMPPPSQMAYQPKGAYLKPSSQNIKYNNEVQVDEIKSAVVAEQASSQNESLSEAQSKVDTSLSASSETTLESLESVWNDALSHAEMWQDAATKEYVFAEENPYKNMEDTFGKGMQLFNEGEIEGAIFAFQAFVQNNAEDCSEGWRMLGVSHQEHDQDREAIGCLERAVQEDPYNLEALLALGVSYVNELDSQRALTKLKAWVEHHPKFQGMDVMQDAYSDGTLMDEVMQLMLSAQKVDPTDPDVQIVLGVLYNVSRDYDSAASAFRKALNTRPDDYSLWNKVGATLANGNKSSKALPAYNRALELKPKYARGWLNMGISHANLGSYPKAVSAYLKTLQLNPGATHVWSYLRIAFTCMERFDLVEKVNDRNPAVFSEFI